jgi:hypothetical protein
VGYSSRSDGLFRLKVSCYRVFQSALKTDGGATVGGARDTIMKVTSGSN